MLNKPVYVGFTVLELSKWLKYDFHYNYIKKKFGAELLFTDTESLTFENLTSVIFQKTKNFMIIKMKWP